LVFVTYKVDERHVEAEIAETVADVPQHDLRSLSYVCQRAVTTNRSATRRTRARRPYPVVIVVVRLGVEPLAAAAAAAAAQLASRGVLARREVPTTDDASHEHHGRRTAERDAKVEVLQQPRVDRVEEKTS